MNETATPDKKSGRKRTATIGLAAGLLAGGAIGLAATVPSLTSAATQDDVPALQYETTEPVTETADTGTDTGIDTPERAEPGERLRETLQPLVDDGTIGAAQADAVAEHLVDNRPEREFRPGRPGMDGHGRHNRVVADLLGIDAETLRAELMAGRSVADIAAENGVDVQTVIDALIADAESHVDLAIDHGLDEERAAERLERITERIETGVHRTRATDG